MYLNVLETMGMGVGGAALGKLDGCPTKVPDDCNYTCECVVPAGKIGVGGDTRTEGWPCCDDRSFWGDLCTGNFCYGDAELLC